MLDDSAQDLAGDAIADLDAEIVDPPLFETEPNTFGVYRQYTTKPSTDPEDEVTLDSLCDGPTFALAPTEDSRQDSSRPSTGFGQSLTTNFFAPFLNATVFRLMDWFYSTTNAKSAAGLDHLVHDVILAPDFDRESLRNFSTRREIERLDKYADTDTAFLADDGWHEGSVSIPLPESKVKYTSEEQAPQFAASETTLPI